jgi:hypothetical protein
MFGPGLLLADGFRDLTKIVRAGQMVLVFSPNGAIMPVDC